MYRHLIRNHDRPKHNTVDRDLNLLKLFLSFNEFTYQTGCRAEQQSRKYESVCLFLSTKRCHPVFQSVVIDEESAKKLQVVVTEANVIVNIPFIVISVGILLGVIFIVFICRQQVPEVRRSHHWYICDVTSCVVSVYYNYHWIINIGVGFTRKSL